MRILILLPYALFLLALNVSAQFTSVQAGDWDDCATWGTCPGTVIGTDYPGRTDNVIINHAVSINSTLDNSATNTRVKNEGIAGVCGCTGSGTTGCGNNPTGCNSNSFYHKGVVTINNGGNLTSSVSTTFEGDVEVSNGGAFRMTSNNADVFLIGRVDVRTGGSFISNDNLIISGTSVINIENGSTAGLGDDLYIDGDNAFVCGAGTLELDDVYAGTNRNNSIRHENTTDGTTTDQICSNTTVTCADGNCCGANCDSDIDSGAGAGDGEVSPGDGSADPPTVLPVELTFFGWKDNVSSIIIQWVTASELNNEGFDLYKSTNGSDFSHVAFITGSGNSNQEINYEYVDNTPTMGANYYRLVQRDFDGQIDDLGIIRAFSKAGDLFTIYPNPAKDRIHILTGNQFLNSTARIRLFSISGQMIVDEEAWVSSNSLEIDLSVEKGVYFIEVDNGTFSQKKRIIVK